MSLSGPIKKELKALGTAENAQASQRFFKTGKGQYGEGDKFHGVKVPLQRSIAKKCWKLATRQDIANLLDSSYHEERLTALFILVEKFKAALKRNEAKEWVELYLEKIDRVNNWDLVDSSAPYILGMWLVDKKRDILYSFAKSDSLWLNRIAVLSCFYFIRQGQFDDIEKLTRLLIKHPHDLIHKAIGWMLREAWQLDPARIEKLLNELGSTMPRTMLRYAIEKMEEEKRKRLMGMRG